MKIPRITGTGWSVPEKIRLNNDPIFDWLHQHPGNAGLFEGYNERHVLDEGQTLMDIMVPAAQMALENAGIQASEVDFLLGTASISEFIQPNALSQLHQKLGLPKHAWVLPLCNDYSNFAASLFVADSLLQNKRAKNVLICAGGNWTRNVDYHTPQSVSAADGAGAAVMSLSDDQSKWRVVDQVTVTDSSYYGSMFTNGNQLLANPPVDGYATVYSPHYFQITQQGLKGFADFGEAAALEAVKSLLQKLNLTAADVSFMPHQTSSVLIKYWCEHLDPPPAQILSTLAEFANSTVAIHALNLAYFEQRGAIEKDKLLMMALGPDMHCNAMLLQRNEMRSKKTG